MAKRANTTTITNRPDITPEVNANFEAVNEALENTLSLDGSTPNSMGADFDMNNNDILNAKDVNTANLYIGGTKVVPTDVVNSAWAITKEYDTVAELLADTATYTAGLYFHVIEGDHYYKSAASGATDHHVTTAGGVKLYVQYGSQIFAAAFGMEQGEANDARIPIQKCIDVVEALPRRERPTIILPPGDYYLNSSYPAASLPQGTFGQYSNFQNKLFGIVIREGNSMTITAPFGSKIWNNTGGSIDAIWAFVKAGSITHFEMSNIELDANTTVQADAPDYVVKSYCEFISHSKFSHCYFKGAQQKVMELCSFLSEYTRVSCVNGWADGMAFTTEKYDGTHETNTSLKLNQCYALQVANRGFVFQGTLLQGFGVQGMNFIEMNNCAADKIGYNPTTAAQSSEYRDTSYAVEVDNYRTFNITAFGCEDVWRAFKFSKGRYLNIAGFQVTDSGDEAGVFDIGAYAVVENSRASVVSGLNISGNIGPYSEYLQYSPSVGQEPDNGIVFLDPCIPLSEITVDGQIGVQASNVIHPEMSMYRGFMRTGLASGSPTDFYDTLTSTDQSLAQENLVLTKHIKLGPTNAAVSGAILLKTDTTQAALDGVFSVVVKVTCCDIDTTPGASTAPAVFIGTASSGNGSRVVSPFVELTSGGEANVSNLRWTGPTDGYYLLRFNYGIADANRQQFYTVEIEASGHRNTQMSTFLFGDGTV